MIGNEIEILKILQSFRTEFLNTVFEYVTMLGEETLMILALAILYFAVNKKFAQKVFYVVVTSMSVNGIVKSIAKVPRPFSTGEITCVRKSTATGYSFPSGHTQTFSTSIMALGYAFKKVWFYIISILLIALVAFSRMYLGAHYLSDVVVGATLGIFLAISLSQLHDKFKDKRKLYLITIALLTPFAIYFVIDGDVQSKGFYKTYGMLIGLLVSDLFEGRFAPLQYNVSWFKKIIRIVLAIGLAFMMKEAIKALDVFDNIRISLILNAIRYFFVVFVPFGLFPLVIKKIKL